MHEVVLQQFKGHIAIATLSALLKRKLFARIGLDHIADGYENFAHIKTIEMPRIYFRFINQVWLQVRVYIIVISIKIIVIEDVILLPYSLYKRSQL